MERNHQQLSEECAIFTAHDEYFTDQMVANVDRFLKKNNNVAIFSGNFSWGKVDYENNIITKNRNPTDTSSPFAYTASWDTSSIHPKSLFYLDFFEGGYPLSLSINNHLKENLTEHEIRLSKGIKILDPHHPIFANLNLKAGEIIGADIPLIYYEVDGAPLVGENKQRASCIRKLGSSLVLDSYLLQNVEERVIIAEKKIENRGIVIHFGSVGWYLGLETKDSIVEQIYLNTVKYLLSK